MPAEMPRGKRKALYKHKSVHSGGTIGIVRIHLITSLMYPCIPRPIRHSGLVNTWISSIVLGVIIRLGRVKINPPILLLHKISSIKSIYSFEEINQEINDAAVEALPPWKLRSRRRRTWGTRTMTSRAAAWTPRGRSRGSGATGTRAWSCTSTPGVKPGNLGRAQCPHIWNIKC